MLINFHHIIIDEWSLDLFFHELQQLYPAKVAGLPLALPELPIQYTDFALWQAGWLQTGALDKQLSYWKEKLAGAPQLIELKTDFPRPAVLSYRGANQERLFSGCLLDGLRELGKAARVTLFTTLLAAFQVLLYRYTGQEDMLLGTPIANRRQVELENLIGFFLNTLVIRCDLSGAPTFRQLLKRVETVVLEAFDNQDLPFERLVEELNPPRDRSRHPLFQISFVLNAATARESHLPGLQTNRLALDFGGSKFDLTIYLVERPEGLNVRLEYNTGLFEAATIERLLDHFETLLQAIVANPDQPVDRLPLLIKAEQDLLLFTWNSTRADYPSEKCIHHLFEEQVQRTPDALAVISESESLTYRELDARANQLARYLQGLGVTPDSLVGICLDSSPELVVAILGTLKAGGAYIPLDPNYPEQRISFMLADARAQVLLTRQSLLSKVGDTSARLVCLDAGWPAIAQEPSDRPHAKATPENLAYVIYTSGSTGVPKGVMIPHRALCNHMTWMQAVYPLTGSDKVLQKTLVTFDASVWEFYAPLLVGAQLVTIKTGGHRDISYLIETIQRKGITILQVVPSILHLLVADLRFPQCNSLRRLFSGGEALTPDLAAQVYQALDLELVNLYGPAEACIDTITISLPPQAAYPVIPVGRPVSNTRVYILDGYLQPVPIGVPGEIFIGGDSLGRGYWRRPDLTAASFIPDPFTPEDEPNSAAGQRLYRTGDRGRFLSDGTIEYLGRLDDQVKLAGVRIELAEIEAALLALPGVGQAIVTLHQPELRQNGSIAGPAAEKRLVAYIVPDAGRVFDLTSIRSAVASKLPEYMLPAVFVPLEALPLSPNGKVDRQVLPDPVLDRPPVDDLCAPPRDELEHSLCQVWESVLNIHPVGIHDNFFELGGHSLLAIRLAGHIEQQLGQRLPIGSIFQSPTVAGLAETLRQTGQAAPSQRISHRELDGPAPLSFGQARLWFLDRLGLGAQAYNVPTAFRIRGPLNVAALERALNCIIRRHAILRTTFVELDGEPRQVIAAQLHLQVNQDDLSACPPLEIEAIARRRLFELGRRSFDLACGPLIYVDVLRIAEQDHFLLLTMHHIISDEWSSEIFNRELAQLYQADLQGLTAGLPELPVQYADYAAWQIEWLEGQNEAGQLTYWKQELSGAPQVLDLPTDHPRPAAPSYRGGRKSLKLSGELLGLLQRLCRSEQVTLFVTLLAAFQVLLYRYTGQEDLLVGSPVANRRQFELENLIGFFLNTLVFRANLKGNPGFRELLQRVSRSVLEAFEHQDLPFERLVEQLKPPRDLGRSPLFQTMFVSSLASCSACKSPVWILSR